MENKLLIFCIVIAILVIAFTIIVVCNTNINTTYSALQWSSQGSTPQHLRKYITVKQTSKNVSIKLGNQVFDIPTQTITGTNILFNGIFGSTSSSGPWTYYSSGVAVPSGSYVMSVSCVIGQGQAQVLYSLLSNDGTTNLYAGSTTNVPQVMLGLANGVYSA